MHQNHVNQNFFKIFFFWGGGGGLRFKILFIESKIVV